MCQTSYVPGDERCPLCGESRESELTWLDDSNIECARCGMIFSLSRPGMQIEEVSCVLALTLDFSQRADRLEVLLAAVGA